MSDGKEFKAGDRVTIPRVDYFGNYVALTSGVIREIDKSGVATVDRDDGNPRNESPVFLPRPWLFRVDDPHPYGKNPMYLLGINRLRAMGLIDVATNPRTVTFEEHGLDFQLYLGSVGGVESCFKAALRSLLCGDRSTMTREEFLGILDQMQRALHWGENPPHADDPPKPIQIDCKTALFLWDLLMFDPPTTGCPSRFHVAIRMMVNSTIYELVTGEHFKNRYHDLYTEERQSSQLNPTPRTNYHTKRSFNAKKNHQSALLTEWIGALGGVFDKEN